MRSKPVIILLICLSLLNLIPSGHASGIDGNTVLMLHLNSDFADSSFAGSGSPHTITPNGVTIDTSLTAYPLTGETGAGKFVAASNQYLDVGNPSVFNLGTSDFTFEFQWRPNSLPTNGNCVIFSQILQSATNWIQFNVYNASGTYVFIVDADIAGVGAVYANFASSGLSIGTFYHIAFVRASGVWYVFQRGMLQTKAVNNPVNIAVAPIDMTLGAGYGGQNPTDGWYAEVRWSNVARWTSNFTPPTAPYSTSGATTTTTSSTTTSSTSTTSTSSSTQATHSTSPLPCSYMITANATAYTAISCNNGSMLYSSTLAAPVIDDAIGNATSGGKIFIKAGTYTFTTTPISLATEGSGNAAYIGTTSVSNVELYGEGNSTILRGGPAPTVSSPQIIGVLNANGWFIHDLQLDGNSNNQNGSTAEYSDGIVLWSSNNSTIQHVYIHNNKNMGIDTEKSSSVKILNNIVKNSGANGIEVTAGSNSLVEGNIIDGTSDVGISISGDNAASGSGPLSYSVCTGNIIKHLNLGISPYGSNAAIGMQIGDNGYVRHVIVSGNTVYGPGNDGIEVSGGFGTNLDISILDDQINGTVNQAILGSSASGLLVEGNVIDYPGGQGIIINSSANNVSISGNYVRANSWEGILNQAPKTLIQGNFIFGANTAIDTTGQWTSIVGNQAVGSAYYSILLDTGSDYSQAIGNYIYISAASQTGLYVNSKDDVMSNNRVYGAGGSDGGITIDTAAVGTVVTDNDFRNTTYPMRDSGVSTVIRGNAGYNPVGHIAGPFVSGTKTILDSGGSSTPVNATTMTVWESPKIIMVVIGSDTRGPFIIKIDGTYVLDLTTTGSGVTTQNMVYTFTLQSGESFYCEYHTGTTFIVSGE